MFFITVIPKTHVSLGYTLLIIDRKEDCHYNLCEEAKLLLPGLTAHLQNGNIRICSSSPKHTRVQPVLDLSDLPNSAKWNILSLVVTGWNPELMKVIVNFLLLKIPLKEACSLNREIFHTTLLKVITLRVTFSIYRNTVHE